MIDPRSVPVRFSRLKNIARSPAHYIHGLTATYDSKAMRLGRLTHHYVLGTGGYVLYDGSRRGKAWEAFEAANAGREIFTADEDDIAERMYTSVMRHDTARRIVSLAGERESTIYWKQMGRQCQGTPDGFGPGYLFDLKTARCAQPDVFVREAIRYHYPSQLAWYKDGLDVFGAPEFRDCYIIAVESAPPYPVTVLRLTDRALEQGRKLTRLWLERLLACEAADEWPGYVQSVVDFDIPDPGDELDLDFGDEDEGEEAA